MNLKKCLVSENIALASISNPVCNLLVKHNNDKYAHISANRKVQGFMGETIERRLVSTYSAMRLNDLITYNAK